MKRERASYYPIFLNIAGRKCVVVGGGEVALRKVRMLLEYGAAVMVVSPQLSAGLSQLLGEGRIKVLEREYRPGDLRGALLVIAATDSAELNRQMAREARVGGVLVNVVDDAVDSDFIVPSVLRRGDVSVAVSTAGRSPALARKIRAGLEAILGEEYKALAELVDEVRDELRRKGGKVSAEDWQEALDLDLLAGLLKRGERDRARDLLTERLGRAAGAAAERGRHAT